jgi:hypothetical protein
VKEETSACLVEVQASLDEVQRERERERERE